MQSHPKALRTLATRGVAAHEVWEVLQASRRLTSYLTADCAVVFGVTGAGRRLVLLALESELVANNWDVVAARGLRADEARSFARYIDRRE